MPSVVVYRLPNAAGPTSRSSSFMEMLHVSDYKNYTKFIMQKTVFQIFFLLFLYFVLFFLSFVPKYEACFLSGGFVVYTNR